jgi:toxin ParE1/3/4
VPAIYVSAQAEADIDAIAEYTANTWGPVQTDVYLAKLEDGFALLARNPLLGRSCDSIREGLRRHEIEKHVVFYRIVTGGIRIVRVLHQRMLPIPSRFGAVG